MAFDKLKQTFTAIKDEVGRIKQGESVASRAARMQQCLTEIASITAEQKKLRNKATELKAEHDRLKGEVKAIRKG